MTHIGVASLAPENALMLQSEHEAFERWLRELSLFPSSPCCSVLG
jgi:hypothetical protein